MPHTQSLKSLSQWIWRRFPIRQDSSVRWGAMPRTPVEPCSWIPLKGLRFVKSFSEILFQRRHAIPSLLMQIGPTFYTSRQPREIGVFIDPYSDARYVQIEIRDACLQSNLARALHSGWAGGRRTIRWRSLFNLWGRLLLHSVLLSAWLRRGIWIDGTAGRKQSHRHQARGEPEPSSPPGCHRQHSTLMHG